MEGRRSETPPVRRERAIFLRVPISLPGELGPSATNGPRSIFSRGHLPNRDLTSPNPHPQCVWVSPSPGGVEEETPDEHSHGTSPSITTEGVNLFRDGLGATRERRARKQVSSQVPVSLSLFWAWHSKGSGSCSLGTEVSRTRKVAEPRQLELVRNSRVPLGHGSVRPQCLMGAPFHSLAVEPV